MKLTPRRREALAARVAGIFACFSRVFDADVNGKGEGRGQGHGLVRWSRPFLVSDPNEVVEVDESSDP